MSLPTISSPLRLAFAVTLLVAFSAAATEQWPYPQDVPEAQPLDIGTASDRPVDISRFLLARGARSGKMSHDGKSVAFTSNVTGVNQLWVMPTNGGQAKQLTFGNGISGFNWHPNSEQLIYRADNDGDEREAYFLISKDGLKENIVLPSSDAFRVFGAFDQSENRFSFASTERNGRDFDIYVHDLTKGETKRVFEAEFGFFPQAWRPNSQDMLVTETRGEDGKNLYLLNTESGKLTTLFKPDISANFNDFNWEKSGNGFYFSGNQNGEMMTLQYHDLRTDSTSTLAKADFDIEDVTLCNQGSTLLYTVNDNGFEKVFVRQANVKDSQTIATQAGVHSISCSQTETALLTSSGSRSPGTLSTINLTKQTSKTILEPDLAGIMASELVEPKVVTFPARDGVTLQGLLYLPDDTETQPPIVIDIHGGPTAQSKASWQPLAQYLVGKGIAVLDINVRGSTGFGKTYARLDNQEKRLDSVRDLVDALAWLEQDGRVDAKRAAAIGGSYGGYMVNAVMGAYPEAFKAGASFVGVADWVRALQTASPALKASDRIEYGDISEPKWQDFYAKNSPINTVDKIIAPMFFQHGVNDPRDPVLESDTMVKALRARNIPVTYLRMPDEGHSIGKLVNRVIFYRQLAAFLETHLMSQKIQ